MAEAGFRLAADTMLAPDYAFISYARMPARPGRRGYAEVVPDLVAKVFSPHDRPPAFDAKIRLWLAAGVRLVLAVYPGAETIHAHYDAGPARRFDTGDILTGAPALPGFTVPVADIFAY